MDSTDSRLKQRPNPVIKANVISKAFFWWMTSFLWNGYKNEYQKEDLYEVLSEDDSKVLGDQLEREWDKELERKASALKSEKHYNPSLTKAILRAFGFKFSLLGFFVFIEECVLRICQPLFMSWFIRYFSSEDSGITLYQAYGYGFGVVAMAAIYCFIHHQYFFGVMHTGMKLRVAHCSFIYRKALRLSRKAQGESTIGQMVNLLSNDVNRFDYSAFFVHYFWVGPLQLLIVLYISWSTIGPACFVGAGLVVAFVPLQSWIGKQFSKLRSETAIKTDERIRIMNEIIQGIKVIKMYAWEFSFAKMLQEAREAEVKVIRKTWVYKAFNNTFFFTSCKVIMALILLTYVLLGEVLTAEKAFLTLALFNVVRLSMTLFFPLCIQLVSEALISVSRIQKFIEMEELDQISTSTVISQSFEGPGNLKLTDVKGKWNEKDENNTLENITFESTNGKLTAIVGPVGSGKGSILNAILGEMPTTDGKICIKGKLSYASQESWVFSGNLRQNILFGQSYDAERYSQVLNVCALNEDIRKFEHGDLTLVGERGVALSGGQKARVNLARAIYREADIYMLDDPLSAVDAHVGKHLFNECIKGYLKDKVVILVTHQIQYLKEADQILVLHQGKITHQGNYEDIMKSCEDISSFVTEEKEPPEDDIKEKLKSSEISDDFSKENDEKSALIPENNAPKPNEETSKLGSVSKQVYLGYIKAGATICTGFVLIFATIAMNASFSLSDIWIAKWTNSEDSQLATYHKHLANSSIVLENSSNSLNETIFDLNLQEELHQIEESNKFNLMIYALLVLSLVISSGTQIFQFYLMSMSASKNLHGQMFEKILRAPPIFFDKNPSGTILNRFSKDMGAMDEMLPQTNLDVLWLFTGTMCVFFIVIYVRPLVVIPTVIVGAVFFLLRRFYLKTSRSVKRLEGVTKSPIFNQLSSSLNGLSTIRAFKAEDMMIDEFDYVQNIHSSAFYSYMATTRWFGVYLDWIVVIYLACCVLSFLLMPGDVLGGDVGVAISSCIFLTGALQFGMRQSAEAENLMTSVERVMEYGDLPSEADLSSPDPGKPFHEGVIEFDHISMKYDEDSKLVLRDICFKTQICEKIGIVGRTGAGKSSLITAIFRLTEPSGTIWIDQQNICKMGLHDLRKQISIIPQDPLLFSTSLRRNLDPFDHFPDADIWSALEQAHLAEAVRELKDGLDTKMSEGGSNFSVGQRQLVCLARAILRKNKILILDEATANVDPKTDSMIQETIRHQFKNCTVLTVAHRLNTVMDSDRILVMDDGEVVEFDTPARLLENEEGFLTQLVNQTGSTMKKKLIQMTEQ